MRFVLVGGTTDTATIEGISAAGAAPELLAHTPAADLELVEYGRPVAAPETPVSPTGCPTPAVVTRAVREAVGFDALAVDAGLAARTAAPTVALGADPGGDVRDPEPVPAAVEVFERARDLGRAVPDGELVVGETVPGGTTTALGVLTALGEPHGVSSSLPENPIERKRAVVASGLAASGLRAGDAAGDPLLALRTMGDPVLAAVAGLAVGALERGTTVTFAGGTQLVAAGALVRHRGVDAPLGLATTTYVVDDETADLRTAARALDLNLTVTDPGFGRSTHRALDPYRRGEAKEGAGMGGALMLASRAGVSMERIRTRTIDRYEALVGADGS